MPSETKKPNMYWPWMTSKRTLNIKSISYFPLLRSKEGLPIGKRTCSVWTTKVWSNWWAGFSGWETRVAGAENRGQTNIGKDYQSVWNKPMKPDITSPHWPPIHRLFVKLLEVTGLLKTDYIGVWTWSSRKMLLSKRTTTCLLTSILSPKWHSL